MQNSVQDAIKLHTTLKIRKINNALDNLKKIFLNKKALLQMIKVYMFAKKFIVVLYYASIK